MWTTMKNNTLVGGIVTSICTYLFTPWSRVLLEKLTVNFAASQEIPRIYGTRKFFTVPTSARQLSLSWANSIQSPLPPPTSWRAILILSSHLRLGLPNGFYLYRFRKCVSYGFPIINFCIPGVHYEKPVFIQKGTQYYFWSLIAWRSSHFIMADKYQRFR
jgi:hypothetical protein